jgi:hypothetical protein
MPFVIGEKKTKKFTIYKNILKNPNFDDSKVHNLILA